VTNAIKKTKQLKDIEEGGEGAFQYGGWGSLLLISPKDLNSERVCRYLGKECSTQNRYQI
jgi:hypothetical protein